MLISSVREAKVEMVSALLMVGPPQSHGACAEGMDLVSAGSHKATRTPRGISAGSAFALGQQKAGDGECETEQHHQRR